MAARPRPRPRLVSRQQAVSGETQAVNTVNDEDDLFRRNRGRTAQHWKELEQSDASKPYPTSHHIKLISHQRQHRSQYPTMTTVRTRPLPNPGRRRGQSSRTTVHVGRAAMWLECTSMNPSILTHPVLGSPWLSHPSSSYLVCDARSPGPSSLLVYPLTCSVQALFRQRGR